MRARVPWLTLVLSWLVVGVFLLVPVYRGGYLDDATPVLLLELVSPFAPWHLLLPWMPWIALHLALTLAATILAQLARRRLMPAHFAGALAVVAGLFVGVVGLAIHEYWPNGVFFDGMTIHYDVGDLVGPQAGAPIRFESASDVAAAVYGDRETRNEYRLPYYIGCPQETQTILAYGTWPEHYRLHKALEAMRDD